MGINNGNTVPPSLTYDYLRERVAITLRYPVIYATYPWRQLEALDVIVAYVGVHKKLTSIHYCVFGLSLTPENTLYLGGAQNLRCYKNIAIGRRLCPDCFERGDEARVMERGQNAGKCIVCGKQADYLATAFNPYFYCYPGVDSDSSDSNCLHDEDKEYQQAQELKNGLATLPLSQLHLPTEVTKIDDGTLYVYCEDIPMLRGDVQVFSRDIYGLEGPNFNFKVDKQ